MGKLSRETPPPREGEPMGASAFKVDALTTSPTRRYAEQNREITDQSDSDDGWSNTHSPSERHTLSPHTNKIK